MNEQQTHSSGIKAFKRFIFDELKVTVSFYSTICRKNLLVNNVWNLTFIISGSVDVTMQFLAAKSRWTHCISSRYAHPLHMSKQKSTKFLTDWWFVCFKYFKWSSKGGPDMNSNTRHYELPLGKIRIFNSSKNQWFMVL